MTSTEVCCISFELSFALRLLQTKPFIGGDPPERWDTVLGKVFFSPLDGPMRIQPLFSDQMLFNHQNKIYKTNRASKTLR